ncbi:histone-lysine N-methyltransferase [Salix suchowensis]|nr:histone-lysine N-methyltransferase [Salix suchowensis]
MLVGMQRKKGKGVRDLDLLLLTINIYYPKSRSKIRNNKTENPSLLLHLHPDRSKWLVLSKRLSIQGTSKFKVFDCRLHGCSQELIFLAEKQSPWSYPDDNITCGPHCYKSMVLGCL